ncbi:hypothetical protein Leryth_024336 [Lithospermum erythrorhizon]|nr:hypothetical protein Leryth_024336 [Lithospermum erythrorhizon]
MGRAPCCVKNGLKKGPWTAEEDKKLIDYIHEHGYGNWRTLPNNAGLQRCGKSCRLRWTNYLRPDIKRGKFSFEEEETIIQLHGILGNKWSTIATCLPGRTDNEIKNYWNTHIRKKLLRMGIGPVSHSPCLDLIFNQSCQMNLSRLLLGMQALDNAELLKLANYLFSSSQQQNNPYFFQQNQNQENQLFINAVVPKGMTPFLQSTQFQTPFEEIKPPSFIPFSGDGKIVQSDLQNLSSNFDNFSNQNSHSNELEFHVPIQDYGNQQGCFSHYVMDYPPPSETTTFQSNNSTYLTYQSILTNLSTPSSSSAPPNSNSTSTAYVRDGFTLEDEKESYCSEIVKFEIPDVLDIN